MLPSELNVVNFFEYSRSSVVVLGGRVNPALASKSLFE
ncbi:unannotated protein [freshwater metagenome]|uniref:Unannotated protein n=1 Tax=freshwater metagenome TaxID=449393 RepID=A0A6J6AUV9_9ZZZZ